MPYERKVKTVQNFYKALHDMKTLPTLTCLLCYRRYGGVELEDVGWIGGQQFLSRNQATHPSNVLGACRRGRIFAVVRTA